MRIIGVIDLKDGAAVHARGGRRDTYAAIEQSAGLAVDGNPLTLARLYAGTFGLAEIYVADLDAIASRGAGRPHGRPLRNSLDSSGWQNEIIRRISTVGADLMVDAGIACADDAQRVADTGAATLVVGLETLPSFDALAEVCAHSQSPVAFSLDLRAGVPMTGDAASNARTPEAIARQAAEAGAASIIVLDVARVGVGGGPDMGMLRRIRAAVPDIPLLAGGGVRDPGDLRELAQLGCTGALVATALHDGRLTAEDVAAARAP